MPLENHLFPRVVGRPETRDRGKDQGWERRWSIRPPIVLPLSPVPTAVGRNK